MPRYSSECTSALAPATVVDIAAMPIGDDAILVVTDRAVFDVQAERAETRLADVSGKLREEYPLAASFASASTGTWDPATFQPRTREEEKRKEA